MKLSIITPNYNYSQFINRTIESIVNQDYENFEHIIVDDGSTDNSLQVINNYKFKYPNKIKLICQNNQGQTSAINKGLNEVTGDIIGWINSDDTYCPNVFTKIVAYFTLHPTIDIIFSDTNIVDLKDNLIKRKRYLQFNRYFGFYLGFAYVMPSNTVFFRKKTYMLNKNLNNILKCNMDGEYFSRLTSNCKVKHVDFIIANFRRQASSKAAYDNVNWQQLVDFEVKFELKQTYNSLKISRYIPYKYSIVLKFLFRIYRIILKSIHLHYVLEFIDKRQWNKSHFNNLFSL